MTLLVQRQPYNPFAFDTSGQQVSTVRRSDAVLPPQVQQALQRALRKHAKHTQQKVTQLNPLLSLILHLRSGGYRLAQQLLLACCIPLILGATQVYAMKINPTLYPTSQSAIVAKQLQHVSHESVLASSTSTSNKAKTTSTLTLHVPSAAERHNAAPPVQDAFDEALFEADEHLNQRASDTIQAVVQTVQHTLEPKRLQHTLEAFIHPKEHQGLPQGFSNPLQHLKVTSPFGKRWGRMHKGIDFAENIGASIFATKAGVVIFTGWKGGYGKLVILDHGQGEQTRYGHCSAIDVAVGDHVKQGQTIAKVGSTGHSTGPHLHFEIRRHNVAVNPMSELG